MFGEELWILIPTSLVLSWKTWWVSVILALTNLQRRARFNMILLLHWPFGCHVNFFLDVCFCWIERVWVLEKQVRLSSRQAHAEMIWWLKPEIVSGNLYSLIEMVKPLSQSMEVWPKSCSKNAASSKRWSVSWMFVVPGCMDSKCSWNPEAQEAARAAEMLAKHNPKTSAFVSVGPWRKFQGAGDQRWPQKWILAVPTMPEYCGMITL